MSGRQAIPLLEVKNLRVAFGGGHDRTMAVNGVSFNIFKGETFGIAGESGSGKTTVGRAIVRVVPVTSGEVLYKGERISGKISRALDRKVIREIQMVFQDPMSSINERAKVGYIVSEGLYNIEGISPLERREKTERALTEVGLLPEFVSRFPHEFSGGQRQRIGIARALAVEPEFIIADEPISALDVSIRAQILNLLGYLQKELGLTYLFISHDLSVMRYICDRIAVMYKGSFVELADTERLYQKPLHPYTKSLFSAVPEPNPRVEKQKSLFVYYAEMHDYSLLKPQWREIEPGHFILANEPEFEEYKKSLI